MNTYELLFTEEVSLELLYTSIITGLIIFLLFLFIRLSFYFISNRNKNDKKTFIYIGAVSALRFPIVSALIISLYVSIISLPIDSEFPLYRVLDILVIALALLSLGRSVNYGIRAYSEIVSVQLNNSRKKSYILYASVLVRSLIWALFAIFFLTNIGIEVSAIVAGLGLSGFALAIAFRNLLKDILASFVIVIDRIVEVDDRIKVSDETGVVKKIGIKSSRLVTDSGLEIIIPNTHLVDKKVHNFNKKYEDDIIIKVEISHSKQDVLTELLKQVDPTIREFITKDSVSINLSEISHEKMIYTISFRYKMIFASEKSKHIDLLVNEIYYSLYKPGVELTVSIPELNS